MTWHVKKATNLLDFLKESAPDSSKTTLRSWISEGRILVDKKIIKDPRVELQEEQVVELAKKRQYLFCGIEIMHQDSDLLVIYKPAGMLTVPTDLDPASNAHEYLKKHFKGRTVHLIHRLDREVSGIMVFAFSEEAQINLKEQFEEHSILREYLAVVEGRLFPKKGTWESYLMEDGVYYVRSVKEAERGKHATTHYEVVKELKNTSVLEVTLETGRKNQIRVHTSEAGFPIVGDKKYRSKREFNGRVALQACKLGFVHPITQKDLFFSREPDPEFDLYLS